MLDVYTYARCVFRVFRVCFACFEKALNTVLVAPLTRRRAAWIYSGTDVCGAVRAVVESLVSTRAEDRVFESDDQAGEHKLAAVRH